MPTYFVCDQEEVPRGQIRAFTVNNLGVLIFHLADGFYATQDRCPHLKGSLKKGRIVGGDKIECPLHKAVFDIKTGQVTQWAHFPSVIKWLNKFKPEKDLITYPVMVENNKLFIIV